MTKTKSNRSSSISSLRQEINTLRRIIEFRNSRGLSAPRNAYPWWKYALVVATYIEPVSIPTINDVLNTFGVKVKCSATLLNNAVKGKAPGKVAREYTNGLPYIVKLLGLKVVRVEHVEYTLRGRQPIYFAFENPKKARKIITAVYPETEILFDEMDSFLK